MFASKLRCPGAAAGQAPLVFAALGTEQVEHAAISRALGLVSPRNEPGWASRNRSGRASGRRGRCCRRRSNCSSINCRAASFRGVGGRSVGSRSDQHQDHRHHHAQRQHAEEHQGLTDCDGASAFSFCLAFLQLQVGQPAVGRRLEGRLGGLGGNEAGHPRRPDLDAAGGAGGVGTGAGRRRRRCRCAGGGGTAIAGRNVPRPGRVAADHRRQWHHGAAGQR